jgi:hypothetical protein
LLLAVTGGCEDPQAAEKEAILACLRQLDEANASCDGAGAVAVMSQRGLDEYTRLVKLALDGSKSDVQSLSPLEMLEVIQLRHRMKRQQLEQMDGKAYQEYATGQCWYTGAGGSWEESIGEIYVSGDTAYADVLDFDRNKSGVQGHFEREGGVWKVNEFSFQRVWDDELTKLAAENNISVPDMIVRFEEMATMEQIRRSIWEPMR